MAEARVQVASGSRSTPAVAEITTEGAHVTSSPPVASDPDQPTKTGRTTGWNSFRGYGFVAPDEPDEPEIHVHFTALTDFRESVAYLVPGERVRYEAEPGQPAGDGRPRQKAIRVWPMPGREHGKVIEYDFQRGHGFLETDGGARYFLHQQNMLGQGLKDADPGDEVTFVIGESPRGPGSDPVALEVKLGDPRRPLYRFAQFPLEYADWLDALDAKAAGEVWGYQYERKGEGGHLPILRYYLEQTFERLLDERDQGRATVVETSRPDGQRVAIFNTGLVTSEEEPIYAFFAENYQPERAPWFWVGFYCSSDRELSDVQVELPVPADYLSHPDELVLRPEEIRAMRVDFHHIAVEHLDRFPEVLRSDSNLADAALRGDLGRLPDRIRRNYKAAVPQRYRGEIQMLLPLDLVAPRGRPDLALVVERRDGTCRANTVLGVDAAYRQARLIARPDPEWLGQAWLGRVPDQGSSTR